MDSEFKERFLQNWTAYFPGAELPIGFYYSSSAESKFMAKEPKGHRCMIGDLAKVRKGETLCFNANTIGCNGGKRYCGFESELTPAFEYFLSYGIPGKLEGERYKKSPEMVKELMKHQTPSQAPENILSSKDGTAWKMKISLWWSFSLPLPMFFPAFLRLPILMNCDPMESLLLLVPDVHL